MHHVRIIKTIPKIILTAIVIAVPLILVSICLRIQFGATLVDHVPFYNDELFHWHQSVTFAEAGFNGGYYTLDENIPIADYSHFYAWGITPYLIYGTLAHFFSFPLHAVATTNTILFMLASTVFIYTLRPSWRKLLALGLLFATFPPLILYLPTSMLQLLNLALVLILAAAFYLLLTRPVRWRFVLAMTIFTLFAGFIRPTYALYLAPMFALADRERTVKSVILAGFKALPLVLIAAVGFYTAAAPFPHFRSLLILGDGPLTSKLTAFVTYIRQSVIWLTEGAGIIMAQRYQIVLLIALLIGWGAYHWWRTRTEDKDSAWMWELALHLYNLVGFYAATILFHETIDGHDYRVMAPHLFFSLLLLLAMNRRTLFAIMLTTLFLTMPLVWQEYRFKAPNFEDTVARQFADWRSIMGDDLEYDPNTSSAWCNTVAVSSFYVLDAAGQPGMILAIKPGLGITWIYDFSLSDFDLPAPEPYQIPSQFNSRYLILTDTDFADWGQSLNLQRLERAPEGAVYLNLDANCGN